MTKRYLLGKHGERLARAYFLQQGFQVLHENYRFGHYEIDLIVKKDDLLVFVEVKTRSSIRYGFPEETLSEKQEERIRKTADQFIYASDWQGRIRFDVISILMRNNGTELRHFPDALY